jgi:hypothetical protein
MKCFLLATHNIAVLNNRVYYALESGEIGSIFMQIIYLPKMNQVEQEKHVINDTLHPGEMFVVNEGEMLLFGVKIDLEEREITVKTFQR